MYIDNLNLYGVNDFDGQARGLVQHVRALLADRQYERARGIVESTVWLNRSAYNELINAFPTQIQTVMQSQPAPVN